MSPPDRGFALAASITFREEGGHNPDDEGSDTWYGVRRANHPNEPWPPTKARALAIAEAEYWRPYDFHRLPPALACAAFDWIFNGGPAIKSLQRVLGVTPDGIIGVETERAAEGCDLRDTLARYMMQRALYYTGLQSFDRNGASWMKRLFSITLRLAEYVP